MLDNTSSTSRTSRNPESNSLNNLDLALRCAEAGLYVLPCNPADRKPLIKWRHGKDLQGFTAFTARKHPRTN